MAVSGQVMSEKPWTVSMPVILKKLLVVLVMIHISAEPWRCALLHSQGSFVFRLSDIPGQSQAVGGASPCKDALSWAEQLWDGPVSVTLEDSRLSLRCFGLWCKKVTLQGFFLRSSYGFTFWQVWVLRSSQECKNSWRFCNPIIEGKSTAALIFPALSRLENKGIKLGSSSSKVSTWKKLEGHASILFLTYFFSFIKI